MKKKRKTNHGLWAYLLFWKHNWTCMFLKIQRLLQQLFSNKSPSELGTVKILRFSSWHFHTEWYWFLLLPQDHKSDAAICSALKWWSDVTFFQRFWKTVTCCTHVLVSLHHNYLFPVTCVCQVLHPVFSPWPCLVQILGGSSREENSSFFSYRETIWEQIKFSLKGV